MHDKIKKLPDKPGVYLFRDAGGKIIYIGKAKSLKKRLASYCNRPLDAKTQAMMPKISDIEYRLTPSESQAQILEAALIKAEQPQYNIDLKDDKSFPWIRITNDQFPIVSICRKKGQQKDDRIFYFGPYTNAKLLRQAIKVIRRIFGFRSCKTMPKQACLYYRLKLCPAPCIKKISARKYKERIQEIRMFLDSRYEELLQKLAQQMKEEAGRERFEEAASTRDQIMALGAIAQTPFSTVALDALEDLQRLLCLKQLPERIEAFDISNISGQEACGSLVSFYQGVPDKNNYRRFRIKTVKGADDYKMLAEVVQRRYSRLVRERLALPDLILIDGGRAHLSTARKELKKLGLVIPLVSIAKEQERVYTSNCKTTIKFSQDTPALNLIRRIRDQAHRFAQAYHHLLRRKKTLGH